MKQSEIKEVWLVRHGQTEANVERRLAGWKDVSLSSFGIKQAISLRPILEKYKFDTVWSSDLKRSIVTANLAFHQKAQLDIRLREIDFGVLDGELWNNIEEKYREELLTFKKYNVPNGENLDHFFHRVNSFIKSLPSGKHLIFTHRGVIRAIMKLVNYDKFLPPGSIIAVDLIKKKIIFELLGKE